MAVRTFLRLVFGLAVIGGVLKDRERQTPPAAPPAVSAPKTAGDAPAARHWPKKALARAAELKLHVAKQRADE